MERIKEILNKKVTELVLFLILFFMLEFEYMNFVNLPFFQEKMGFAFEFVWWKYIIVKLILAALLLLNINLNKFNFFVNSIFLIFLTFPLLIMYEFMPGTPVIISLFAVLFHTLYWWMSLYEIKVNIKDYKINKKYSLYTLLAVTLLMLIPFLKTFGFKINTDALMFNNIYKIREIASLKSTVMMSYFLNWLIKILIPVGIIMSYKQRKFVFMGVFVLFQIYLFSTGAHKSAFFSLFVILLMFLPSYRYQIRFVLFTFVILIIASKIISLVTNDLMAESIVVRRTFFLPAIIVNDYFDFFKDNHIYLSHSILKSFIEYPYDLQPEQIISVEYFNSHTGHCNSGFISDGFMNFGYTGVILNIIGLLAVFKIMEIIKIPHLYAGVLLIIIYTFISSYFLTSLLTHGVILFIILAFFILRTD